MSKKETVYETLWRNKFLCTDTTTFDEFIGRLELAVADLKEMREAGIKLEEDGIGDDYARFTTTDPKIAEKFGMEVLDWDEDEEEMFLVTDSEDEIHGTAETIDEAVKLAHETVKNNTAGVNYYVEFEGDKLRKYTKLVNGTVVEEVIDNEVQ